MSKTKIVLINPPWLFATEQEIILSQNLGLGYLAAFLSESGHDVSIIDALALGINNFRKFKINNDSFLQVGLDYKQIVKRIPEDVDFIGISSPFSNNAKIVKQLAKEIKSTYPEKPIILGGVYPSLCVQKALTSDIDYYVIGEGEIPLLEIAKGVNPDNIKGVISYKNPKKKIEQANTIEDLDKIPFPARDKLPMEQYLSFSSPRRDINKTASIITSRGCPYDCGFCSIHSITGYKWRARSPENVIEEIKLLVKNYNVRHIEFEDDNLTLDKTRMQEIASQIIKLNKQGLKFTWSAPNGVRIDTLDENLLKLIKESNCVYLSLPIESGDPQLLKKMNKKLDLNKVIEVVKICKKLKITTNAFFIIGYPGETKQSFEKTLVFVKKLKALGVNKFYATLARAYEGTKLFNECRQKQYIQEADGDQTIFLGNEISQLNAIKTKDFSIEELKKRYELFEKHTVVFYLRFYHRHYFTIKKIIPIRLIKLIKKILVKE